MSTALSKRVSKALRPLFRRDMFANLDQEIEDMVGRFRANFDGDWPVSVYAPAVDLSEADGSFQVRMDAPGLKPDEINIEVSGNTLRISGEHKEEKEEKGKTYHYVERRSGSFSRSVTLPAAVIADKVSAECKDGVLTIALPKVEVTKTQTVKVTAK